MEHQALFIQICFEALFKCSVVTAKLPLVLVFKVLVLRLFQFDHVYLLSVRDELEVGLPDVLELFAKHS